jgi:hypothetical protein
MLFDVQGRVSQIEKEITGEGKAGTWTKQDLIVETQEQYSKKMHFSAWGEKSFFLKDLLEGDQVKISFTIESREFNQRWYTDLRIFKLEKMNAATPTQNEPTNAPPSFQEPQIPQPEDDLPF